MFSIPSSLADSGEASCEFHELRAQVPSAQYLLVCQASAASLSEGNWSFALETADGAPVFTAEDVDFGDLNRLTLLAAVRGLESIDGPSSVTLLSTNRYLIRSLAESLPRWRENQFVWEHFGRRIDVQHADLWRRVDRALQIHRVQACLISSRLVSGGRTAHETQVGQASQAIASRGDGDRWLRVDSPHQGVPRRRQDPLTQGELRPRDGLRQWLLTGGGSPPHQPSRHRFTAADLLESA